MSPLVAGESTEEFIEQARASGLADLRPFDRLADETREIPVAVRPALDAALREIASVVQEDDPVTTFAAVEALAFGSPTLAHAVLPKIQAMVLLGRLGTADQQFAHQESFLESSELTSILMTETNGRGPAEWDTTASREGDIWRVDGRKIAVHGEVTGPAILAAKSDAGKVVVFLSTAIEPSSVTASDVSTASMALGASRLANVQLSGLVVEEKDRLSGADDEPFQALRAVALARLLLAAVALGAAEAAMAYARDWVVTRTAFGKPLAAYEGVAFDVADHDTRLSMARLSLARAAHEVSQAVQSEAIDELVARALSRVTSISAAAAVDGVQLMGVHGIIHEHPQELFHRTASAISILDCDPLQSGFHLF